MVGWDGRIAHFQKDFHPFFILLDDLGGCLVIPMGEIELLYGKRQILRLQRGNGGTASEQPEILTWQCTELPEKTRSWKCIIQ